MRWGLPASRSPPARGLRRVILLVPESCAEGLSVTIGLARTRPAQLLGDPGEAAGAGRSERPRAREGG
jgi:hypothetical protein